MTLVVCLAILVAFGWRARLGARARAASGVRLRIVDRAMSSANASLLRAVASGAIAAAWLLGWAWVVPGGLAGWAFWFGARRRDGVRAQGRMDEQVPDAMRAIAAGLRAGGGLPLALAAAGEEMPAPLGPHLARCAGRCLVGAPLEEALEILADQAGSDAVARMAETLRVGAVAGASLPRILDTAAGAQEEWARLARDRLAATAQARLSALVVGAMPIAFLTMAGPAARGPARVLLREPIGWVLLAAGLSLDVLGWVWMRALGQGGAR